MEHEKKTAAAEPYHDPIATPSPVVHEDAIVHDKPVTPGSSSEIDSKKNHEVEVGEKSPEYSTGDAKDGSIDSERLAAEEVAEPKTGFSGFYAKYRIFFHLFIW